MSVDLIKAACELCGVEASDYTENHNALAELAELYLQMQMAADLIAGTDEFDPHRPETFNRAALESRFPTTIVKKILALAILQVLSLEDISFRELENLGKTQLQ